MTPTRQPSHTAFTAETRRREFGRGNISAPSKSLTADVRDNMLSFVGNRVRGGGVAMQAALTGDNFYAYRATFCGNDIQLSPPWDPGSNEGFGAAALFRHAELINASGNTLAQGYKGISFDESSTNAVILKNDLSGTAQGGVFMTATPESGYSVIAKNILSNGRSFHVYGSLPEGQKRFVLQNTFRAVASTNSVQPIYDTSSLPVHFNP